MQGTRIKSESCKNPPNCFVHNGQFARWFKLGMFRWWKSSFEWLFLYSITDNKTKATGSKTFHENAKKADKVSFNLSSFTRTSLVNGGPRTRKTAMMKLVHSMSNHQAPPKMKSKKCTITMPLSVVNGKPRKSPVMQLNRTADVEFPMAPLIGFHMIPSWAKPKKKSVENAIIPQMGSIRELIASVAGSISVTNRRVLYPLSLYTCTPCWLTNIGRSKLSPIMFEYRVIHFDGMEWWKLGRVACWAGHRKISFLGFSKWKNFN